MQALEDWAANLPPSMANDVASWFKGRLAELDDPKDQDALVSEWFDAEAL